MVLAVSLGGAACGESPEPAPAPEVAGDPPRPTPAVELAGCAEIDPGHCLLKPKATKLAPKPPPKPPPPKKKPRRKAIDPTKPIDRPENATVPKPLASNAKPKHPKKLRDEGITGKIVVKLQIYRDGTVRGAKILRKKTSATTAEDKKEAEKLFLAAVIKAVKTWKYKPATLEGKPITVWHTVTIPFTLTSG